MDDWELDGVHSEIERLAALHQSRKPLYSDRFVSKRTAGTEHLGAPRDAALSHDDLLAAQRELAEQHGVSSARVRGLCMLTAARAGLGHSIAEEAAVLSEVALTMESGKMNVSDEQVLKLSGLGSDTVSLAGEREAARDEAAVLGLTVTAEQRAKFAKSGIAMDDGAFPIADEPHLTAAKRAWGAGHLAGHSAAEVARHINARAKALNLPGIDPKTTITTTISQESQAALALAAGQDSADAVIARHAGHPEFEHLFKKAGKTSNRKHPSGGRKVTTESRAHSSDLDEGLADEDQPGRGGRVHPEVARMLAKHRSEMGYNSEDEDAGTHGSKSHRPLTPSERHIAETYSLAGGRPQGRIT